VRLVDLLSPRRVVVPLPAATLEEGMRILVDACVADGRVSNAARLDQAIRESWPEDTMSLGPHAWLPHFRTDAVPGLVVALGIAARPIAAGPREGGPKEAAREAPDPRMILLVVAPPREHAAYLQAVAAFARALSRPQLAAALLVARSAAEVLALPGLGAVELEGQLLVRDLMRAVAAPLRPDDPLDEAARRLEQEPGAALPVVGDAGQVVGLLSHRELLKVLALGVVQRVTTGATPADPQQMRVRDAMARSVLCVSEEQTLADAAHLLATKDVDWVPVVKDGVLRGAVTRADLVRRLLGSH
jgi:CBS domain-containing protein